MKLDERDERILALLGTATRSVADLAGGLDVPSDVLADRLAALADNGLVYDRGAGRYERTESGRRVLVASALATDDERIDTSPEVEAALESFSLRPDEADAVRHAFSLVRYWGHVADAEIVDAIYDEVPAGRETADEWWEELVREPLAALPGVDPPQTGDDPWRYAGPPEAGDPFTDGRRVLSKTHPVYGDVKHALESLGLTETERAGARAAFVYLYRRGEVAEEELLEAVYPDHPAGFGTPRAWLDELVAPAFDALPRVERAGPDRWRYRRG